MLTDLPSLLAPTSEADFLEHFHGKTRMWLRAGERDRAGPLLPWSRIEEIVSADTLDERQLSVIRDNTRVPARMYRSAERGGMRAGALNQLTRQGVSLVINDVDRMVPAIGCLTADIERRLGCRVQANAYVSFGRKSAFERHWDNHDVLIVQVHGRKTWRFWPGPVAYPLDLDFHAIDRTAPPQFETLIDPGDVLFIPRGEVHMAEVLDEPSAHLTISLLSARGVRLLDWLAEQARADPLFRMDLMRSGDPQAFDAHEAELKRRLHALVDAISLRERLQSDDRARAPRARVSLEPDPPSMDRRLGLNLLRRLPLPAAADGETAVDLPVADQVYRLTPVALAVLAWLFDHPAPTLGAVCAGLAPRHGEDSVREGVAELVRCGLVSPLPDFGRSATGSGEPA